MSETKMLHIRFPAEVVEQMTAYLKTRGVHRNRFIVDAVIEKLRREMQVKSFKETRGVLTSEDALEWTQTSATEWIAKLRAKDRVNSSWDI
ncbi:MAG: YlcI/YnfO family protein [Moorellaceae bacterium]